MPHRRVPTTVLLLLTICVLAPLRLSTHAVAAEENHTEELDRREAELRRGVEATRRQLSSADLRLAAAKKKFETSTQPAADLLEEVEARISVRDALQEKLDVLGERIAVVESELTIWKRRQDIRRGGTDFADAENWRTEVTNVARDAARLERTTNERIADLRQRQSALSTRIAERKQGDPVTPWLIMRREALDDLLTVHEAYLG
jgi:DNA repair exonuclease SbcCD ATPase subunit